MNKRLLAAVSAALIFSAQGLSAAADWYGYDDNGYTDYGYDDGYGYDNNYGYDDNNYYADDDQGGYFGDTSTSSVNDDIPVVDPLKDAPVVVKLVPTKIVDKKFSAELYLDTNTDISSVDLTITYDSNTLKLNKSKVNKKIGGSIAAAETQPGTIQFQYISDGTASMAEESSEESSSEDENSSDSSGVDVAGVKPSFLTLDMEVVDVTERSSVLYITVNSLKDTSNTELTYRSDGTIIQIEGAVPFDPASDESMYTELRVAKSDSKIPYESLGFTNVKQITFADTTVAEAADNGINTLSFGLTNMTVEFNDGTFKYYRLVVSDSVPVVQTQAPVQEQQPQVSEQAVSPDGGIVKTETKSSSRMKYLIIYILVIIGIIAIFAEYFAFFGNPYKKFFAVLKKRKSEKAALAAAMQEDEMNFEQESEQSSEEVINDDTEYGDETDNNEDIPYDEPVEQSAETESYEYENSYDSEESDEDTQPEEYEYNSDTNSIDGTFFNDEEIDDTENTTDEN